MRIVVSDLANNDIEATYGYLAARSPIAARKLIDEFDRIFADLTRFPKMGRQRPYLRRALRSQRVGNYTIFYLLVEDDIVVIRILDGRMNIDREMFE